MTQLDVWPRSLKPLLNFLDANVILVYISRINVCLFALLCSELVKFPFHFCRGPLQERHAKNLAMGDPFDDAANRECPRWIHMRHDPMSVAFSRSFQLILCKELHTQQSSRKSRPHNATHILLTLLSVSLQVLWLWNSRW